MYQIGVDCINKFISVNHALTIMSILYQIYIYVGKSLSENDFEQSVER